MDNDGRKFWVRDSHTGEKADIEAIVREEWASGLIPFDMEGFALTEEGCLLLMDECGNFAYCQPDRFEVVWEDGE